ncbi:MAG: DMT family transporter [Kangiellaceae bacterium]
MSNKDIADLVLLAALWGASFLFMRVAVPEFGPVLLITIRLLISGLFLLPIIVWKKNQRQLIEQIKPLSIVGLFNAALPFTLIAYSTLYVTAGFASVLNSATPIFASIIAFIWLKQSLTNLAMLGLSLGVLGVIILVGDKLSLDQLDSTLAIVAGIIGTICYGVAANYSKIKLKQVDPIVITVGSQLTGAILLLPFTFFYLPKELPSISSWLNLLVLAIACTAFAQIIYFRLLERVGATNATSVTFLIPIFGLFWGYLFLSETFSVRTFIATAIILFGTALTVGIIKRKG